VSASFSHQLGEPKGQPGKENHPKNFWGGGNETRSCAPTGPILGKGGERCKKGGKYLNTGTRKGGRGRTGNEVNEKKP